MARQAQDREDLLHDAKALVPRLMLKLQVFGESCELFVGFRDDALSLYFNADPVYQFNSAGELRRAFVENAIVKAVAGNIHIWRPERSEREVAMQSRELSAAETEEFMENLSRRLAAVREALQRRHYELMGNVPAEGEGLARLRNWLESLQAIEIAETANVG